MIDHDGGEYHDRSPLEQQLGVWAEIARRNVHEWGQQDVETLLLVAQEELGELTQAVLEAEHEGGNPYRARDELDDLAPIMIQLLWAFEEGEP